MPLARRLSSSSKEASENFCVKNKPLSRDADSVSVSSNRRASIADDKGRCFLKRHSLIQAQKRPGSPCTGSPAPKKQRLKKSNRDPTHVKENSNQNDVALLHSPIPNWKVPKWKLAKEKGSRHTPPEIRSAKNKKTTNDDCGIINTSRDGSLHLSLPNT